MTKPGKLVPRTFDFTYVDHPQGSRPMPAPVKHRNGNTKSMDPKNIRARARRAGSLQPAELEVLVKPIDDWDEDELAMGFPRNAAGRFDRPPAYITAAIREEALARHKDAIRKKLRGEALRAVKRISHLMVDDERDEKGKYIVPPSVQLNAAQYILEHNIGKPVQKQEIDISVKLQGILALATAGPSMTELESAEQTEQIWNVESWEDDDDLEPKDAG